MKRTRLSDISKDSGQQLLTIEPQDLMPLPSPCETSTNGPVVASKSERRDELLLDGTSALGFPKPGDPEEEKRRIEQFLSGLRKLLSQSDNWPFWQPLVH